MNVTLLPLTGRPGLRHLILRAAVLAPVLIFFLFPVLCEQTAHSAQVTLTWDASSPQNLVVGYRVHYGTASRSYSGVVDAKNVTTSTIASLQDGQTYYFAATAYDATGTESPYSNETSYTTPGVCTYSLTPTSQLFGTAGGTGSIAVATQSSCSWTIANSASWITVSSGNNKTGPGTVNYTVSSNTSGASRGSSITIAGQIFTVSQSGGSLAGGLPTYTITASAGTGGSISPSGSVSLNQGTSQTFTVSTNPGYKKADVKVDGTSVGAVNSFTFSNVSGNHTIAASFTPITYTLTTTKTGTGTGTVTNNPTGTTFTAGTSVTLTATANSGSAFTGWSGACSGTSSTCTVTMNNNTSVTASFVAKTTYTITATAGTGGSISPSGSVNVSQGASQGFTVTANSGYKTADVKVDGASVGAVSSFTFSSVTANHTIAASFTPITYTITATAGTGGSISPSGSVNVSQGASQTFTISHGFGYKTADVKADGVSVGAVNSFTFMSVTANHTIAATFR